MANQFDCISEFIKAEFGQQCRICMEFDGDMIDLFSGILELANEELKLCEAFEETIGISASEDDKLTRYICKQCVARLKESLILRRQAEASYRKFIERLVHEPIIRTDYKAENFLDTKDWKTENREDSQSRDDLLELSNKDNVDNSQEFCTVEIIDDEISFTYKDPKRQKLSKSKSTSATCKLCGKTFTFATNLSRHMLLHTKERPHVCDLCQRGFVTSYGLKQHRRIHTKEKPYSCKLCSMSFSSSSILKAHQKTHTNEKPYCCPLCFRAFATLFNCKVHVIGHVKKHPNNQTCEVCTRHVSDYKTHIVSHISKSSES